MFARTFALNAPSEDLGNPESVADLIEKHLKKELSGRRPFPFRFFVDIDKEGKKVIFYDVSASEQVIEFSGVFGRIPAYSIECDKDVVKLYHFHEDNALARVFKIDKNANTKVIGVTLEKLESQKESASLRAVASATSGFLDIAQSLDGIVNCSVVEEVASEEALKIDGFVPPRLPFFTIKLDVKSERNRGIIRSCEDVNFAWSEERSFMILLCRFKMLPPFAITFPIMGRNVTDSMDLYMNGRKAVGMVMYTDDVSDTFRVSKGKPIFEIETPSE